MNEAEKSKRAKLNPFSLDNPSLLPDEPPLELEEGDGEEVDEVAQSILDDFIPVIMEDARKKEQVPESGHGIASHFDGLNYAKKFFEWMIFPLTMENFFENFFEKKPFVIKRPNNPGYYNGWFGKDDIRLLLEKNRLLYGMHVDVTSYKNNQRTTLNKEGVAEPKYVWDKYSEGCSIRVLHPQRWNEPLWLMLSTLEQFFSCVVGCNAYLTPTGSQGFAPHYDDIEAFVLQVEGRKRWRCYSPRSFQEVLPLYSSENFDQEEIGDVLLDLELNEGDLLFMPRGTIHQAVSSSEFHSLHVTVSTGQRNTYSDLFQLAIPRALDLAIQDHVELRQSLPCDLFDYFGVAQSDSQEKSEQIRQRLRQCMDLVFESAPWNAAIDQMAAKFMRSRLPPHTSWIHEHKRSGLEVQVREKVRLKTKVKILGLRLARLVIEDKAVVYHIMKNSRNEHNVGEKDEEEEEEGEGEGEEEGKEIDDGGQSMGLEIAKDRNGKAKHETDEIKSNEVKCSIEFDIEFAEAIEMLLSGDVVRVKDLPLSKVDSLFLVERLLDVNVLIMVS